MPLTEKTLKSLKSPDKIKKVSDAAGLYIELHPNGAQYWRLKYRYAGKEKRMALGVYPAVSLKDARQQRDTAKRLLAEGIDPNAKKQEEKRLASFNAENTFISVAKEWHDTNKSQWTPGHAAKIWRRLEMHIFPDIGKRPIADIKSLELLNTIKKIERNGTTETAHRVLQTCNVIFRYSVLTARREYNPAIDLKGALTPHKGNHHPTLEANELADFFNALDKVDTSAQNKLALLFTMLTFTRQGELRHAKWKEIDFKQAQWRIPAENTKMKTMHIVPLSTQAIALLQKLSAITGSSPYLFPSQQRRKHAVMSENTVNKIIHNMGYKDRIVAHGFRALASTILNEKSSFNKDAIERQLAHMERNKVRAAYDRAQHLCVRKNRLVYRGYEYRY